MSEGRRETRNQIVKNVENLLLHADVKIKTDTGAKEGSGGEGAVEQNTFLVTRKLHKVLFL